MCQTYVVFDTQACSISPCSYRFRRALSQLRENVHADQQQGIFGAYGFSGRIGTVLSLNVRRSHLLEDMLKFLGEVCIVNVKTFWITTVKCKDEIK